MLRHTIFDATARPFYRLSTSGVPDIYLADGDECVLCFPGAIYPPEDDGRRVFAPNTKN